MVEYCVIVLGFACEYGTVKGFAGQRQIPSNTTGHAGKLWFPLKANNLSPRSNCYCCFIQDILLRLTSYASLDMVILK